MNKKDFRIEISAIYLLHKVKMRELNENASNLMLFCALLFEYFRVYPLVLLV